MIKKVQYHSVQFSSVAQSCLTLCDPMNRSTPGLPVHHQLPEFTQTHVHRVGDAIQPSSPITSWQIVGGGSVSRDRLYFLGLQNHCGWWLQLWNEKTLAPWEKIGMTNLDSVLKSRDIILLMKVCIVKAIIFPVATYRCELDHKEGWTPKNWCCGAGEDSWESLGQQENQTSPS